MNPFSRVKNLYNIQRTYGYIRDLIEKPELRRNKKHWQKLFKSLLSIQEFREMLNALKGYKTYIVAALMIAVQGARMTGYIDDATADALLKLLGTGAIATVAAKVNRITERAGLNENPNTPTTRNHHN